MPSVGKKPKAKSGKTVVQSLIFPKSKFTAAQAKTWARAHGYSTAGFEETGSSYRIRQYDPQHFSRFRTSALGSRGIKAVIGVVKSS